MTPEAIGARLALIRRAHGMSKAEMADVLEIDRTGWIRFESGQRALKFAQAAKLVARFGVTLDYIYLGRAHTLPFDVAQRLQSAPTED